MFSLQVIMFIICSHIRFFSQTWAFHYVLLICLFSSRCSLFFSFQQRYIFIPGNWSLKNKCVRARDKSQNLASVFRLAELLFYLNAFSLTLHIHCFCFPLLSCSFACVVFWGEVSFAVACGVFGL